MTRMLEQVKISGKLPREYQEILTPEALQFLAELHKQFNPIREELLEQRQQR